MSNSNHEIDCICGDDCGGIKAYIQIYYGPYVSLGILRHRTRRLRNLVDTLEEMGHTVDLIPIKLWDRVEINIRGRTIYRLRLTHLEINPPSSVKENRVCHQAICAVIEALSNMNKAGFKQGLTYERI